MLPNRLDSSRPAFKLGDAVVPSWVCRQQLIGQMLGVIDNVVMLEGIYK